MELLRLILTPIRILTPHPWSWRCFRSHRTAYDRARFQLDHLRFRRGEDYVATRRELGSASVETWGYWLPDAVVLPMVWV